MTLSRARLHEREPMRRQAVLWNSIRTFHRPMPFSASCRSSIAVTRKRSPRRSGPSQSALADAEAHIALGYVQLFAGNHAEAANAVETALKLDPNLSPIDREIAGLVFLLQGNTAKAIETLERTRDDAPAVGDFRITLAAAYARAGRLQDAKAAIADGLRLTSGSESPARRRSLVAWRIAYAHLRNADDLALIIDALRQAGLPEWPFGFTADEQDRLNGAEIASLVLGHTLQGQLEPDGQPAIMQIGRRWHSRLPHDDTNAHLEKSTSITTSYVSRARIRLDAPSVVRSTDAAMLPAKDIPMSIQVRCFTLRSNRLARFRGY